LQVWVVEAYASGADLHTDLGKDQVKGIVVARAQGHAADPEAIPEKSAQREGPDEAGRRASQPPVHRPPDRLELGPPERAEGRQGGPEAASKLQHSSVAVTRRHYRTKGGSLKPVR
jgi:hypothetical protein